MIYSVIISFLVVLLLIGIRIPVSAALITIGFAGMWFLEDFSIAVGFLKSVPFDFAASWSLSSLPMYLFMGYLAFHAGMAERLFSCIRIWLGRVPGGLAVSTVFGCAAFGAVCGSSGATAAAFSRLAIPEMLKDRYEPSLASGCIAASGTMGSLMPPSILMIIYGVLTEESIGRVFMAGVIPCLLSASIYGLMIYTRVKLTPSLAPVRAMNRINWKDKVNSIANLWDILIVICIVFGGIYSGIFTATEAGACGAFAVLILNLLLKRLDVKKIKESLLETLRVTSMVLIIAVGANIYTRFMALAGVSQYLNDVAASGHLTPFLLMPILFCLYFILGMFLDPIGAMLLTIPTLLHILKAMHVNLVWFAILVIKNMELALITPPVGLNVYIIQGTAENIPLETIFKGILWFAVMDIITLFILFFFPQISLILPNYMFD
jgi:tripartite ATP-independent transporter DctM subunit